MKNNSNKEYKGFQIVNWFPYWHGIKFAHWQNDMRHIYDWSLILGFIEIRKWA